MNRREFGLAMASIGIAVVSPALPDIVDDVEATVPVIPQHFVLEWSQLSFISMDVDGPGNTTLKVEFWLPDEEAARRLVIDAMENIDEHLPSSLVRVVGLNNVPGTDIAARVKKFTVSSRLDYPTVIALDLDYLGEWGRQ